LRGDRDVLVRLEERFLGWLVRYGAAVLFFAQAFGIFGLPIPDELLLTVAGVLVARGTLRGSTAATASVAGCLCGITLSYVLGRSVGTSLVDVVMRRHRHALDRARRWFARFGGWLLTFGYFIPGVRHVTAIAAGSGCMDSWAFVRYAYPGGVLWCGTFLLLGYYAGDRWREVAHTATSQLAIAALAAAVVAGLITFSRVAARRRS
jgi:membrane protein DedA with SNARE-associated domain